MTAPDRLRFVTYNLYKANYLDRPGPRGGTLRDDFEGLESLARADVLALQEAVVDRGPDGDVLRDAALELVPWLRGLPEPASHVRFHGFPHGVGRLWGVALASRAPASFEALDLPRPFWSPWQRGAVLARVGAWIVATVHLEVWPIGAEARRRQMTALLGAIDRLRAGQDVPTVVAGDFNCERGGPHDVLTAAGFRSAGPAGEPTWELAVLRLRLDHIYVRGARVVSAGVARDARGSDHRPLWADLEA